MRPDEEVEIAVAIEVFPYGEAREREAGESRARGDVFERAVAAVLEEVALRGGRDDEGVVEAVAVEVAPVEARGRLFGCDACGLSRGDRSRDGESRKEKEERCVVDRFHRRSLETGTRPGRSKSLHGLGRDARARTFARRAICWGMARGFSAAVSESEREPRWVARFRGFVTRWPRTWSRTRPAAPRSRARASRPASSAR